jgi:RNA polymerase sigma-70 factor (ECF subfamily)
MLLRDITIKEEIDALKDEELLKRSKDSAPIFSALVRRYEAPFLRKAKSIIGNDKDAVQDTFLKIYVHAEKFEYVEGASFKSWGYRILINTAFTHYQKLKKKRLAQIDLDPEIYETLMDMHDEERNKEFKDLAWNLLNKLPVAMSRALQLFFLEEYSQKEIAEIEGTSVAAIKTRIYRAKQVLEEVAKLQGDIIT